jgi:hypothetical protein
MQPDRSLWYSDNDQSNKILIKTTRILPLLSFSNKPSVTKLDKLVGEFSSRGEDAFVRGIEGHPSAADLEH